MIDDKTMDAVLPLQTEDELKDELITELEDEGFVITNFSSGGIFYTILMILIRIRIELILLLRTVLNNMFVSHASEGWLELKASDFSKERKQPQKTRGYVSLGRSAGGDAVRIAKGEVFKTDQDINGEELRYIVLDDTVMLKDALTVSVLVEAEKEGAVYNVPPGSIKNTLVHIEGIDTISNTVGWITTEGSDLEDLESFRSRVLNSWAELSFYPIRDKYKNVAESVPGVLFARVDDLQPRGQGTVDVIITSTAGAASANLISLVATEVDKIKGPDDNILVKSSEVVTQNIEVVLTIPSDVSDVGLVEKATSLITDLFKISKSRSLNEFYQADGIYALKKEIPTLKNARFILPATDVVLPNDKVIVLGTITVTVSRG